MVQAYGSSRLLSWFHFYARVFVSIVCSNIYPLNRISFSYFWYTLEINAELTNTLSRRTMDKNNRKQNGIEPCYDE